MNLDKYWEQYGKTLARIRKERPKDFAGLKVILDYFVEPSSGEAFFPSEVADDTLADALRDAGWRIRWIEGDYLWEAYNFGNYIHHVEGDLYTGQWKEPGE